MSPEELIQIAKEIDKYDNAALKAVLLEAAKKIADLEDTLRSIDKTMRLM